MRARRVNRRRLVFIDEAGVNTAMTRRYGRAPRGERVHDSVPRNYGSHTSVIGAMGLRGLVATLTVEGAVDTLRFDAYAEKVLAPRLRKGDVVVLDDLGAHRASRIEEVAGERGAQALWLAPYSPDFSPVEQCRSKIKTSLRGAKARTGEELDRALAQAIGLRDQSRHPRVVQALRLLTRTQVRTAIEIMFLAEEIMFFTESHQSGGCG